MKEQTITRWLLGISISFVVVAALVAPSVRMFFYASKPIPPVKHADGGGRVPFPAPVPIFDIKNLILGELLKGRIWNNIPKHMKQGKDQTIVVRISANSAEDITAGYSTKYDVHDAIDVYPTMTVKLSGGESFATKPITPEDQLVSTDKFTEWQFEVIPLIAGEHDLNVIVGIRVKVSPGSTEMRFNPTYGGSVTVDVDRLYSAGKYWDANYAWISGLGAGMLALIGCILGVLTYRRGGKPPTVNDNDRA